MRIAVIGTGLIGRKHIGLIDKSPHFELAATVNHSGVLNDVPAAEKVPIFLSHHDLLRGADFQCAIIASPNETHADIAVDLIDAGIPILIEKPITGSVADGMRVIEAADRHGVPVLMGHHRRHNPVIGEMQEIVESGVVGPIIGFSGVWSVYKPDPYYETAWRTGPTGGPIMINLIHELDYLHAILGPVVSISATQSSKRRIHAGEETVALLLTFACGAIGTVLLSDSATSPWSWEQATGENSPAFPMTKESPYRFLFKNGAVEFPRVKIWRQDEPSWYGAFEIEDRARLQSPMVDVFERQIEHFYWVARGDVVPKVTARAGLDALNVAIAVKEAISGGPKYIEIPQL